MKKDSLLFSIIVPVYNAPKEYFEACMKSLLSQTIDEYEIILVNDGSGEACKAICDEYASQNARVRVIHQANQGVSAARNNGIKAAEAEWIMFVDADDWLEPQTCQTLKPYLDGCNCDLMMFDAVKDYENRKTPIHFELESGQTYYMTDVGTCEFFYRNAMHLRSAKNKQVNPFIFCWNKVYRKSFLMEKQLMFPVGIPKSEDKVFSLLCLEKADRIFYRDDVFYHYRVNEASVCHKFSQSADKDRIQLAETLHAIARRMDGELSAVTGEKDYNRISRDYYRFIFGIISDVLFLKYYHQDNPDDKKSRTAAARKFVMSEPFKTAIDVCSYQELSAEAKLKKFLLSNGLVGEFCTILKLYRALMTKPQKN